MLIGWDPRTVSESEQASRPRFLSLDEPLSATRNRQDRDSFHQINHLLLMIIAGPEYDHVCPCGEHAFL